MYVQPLIASLIAWLCLGQVPTIVTALGGVLAVGGVVLTVGATRKAAAPSASPILARPLARACCTQS
jgi:drug/metabolite transporter (DMT)-like permease